MHNRAIKKEANLFFQGMAPLLNHSDEFQNIVLGDLAKLVRICGQANGFISSKQLLAFLMTYALIKQDTDKLKATLNQWETTPALCREFEKKTLKILLRLTHNSKESDIDSLSLPAILNRMDEQGGSNRLEPT
ncbi:MAG: hypothetical protein F6K09_03395, partial [Merismopedia sp. SIO2A8]|nr:hypothetical protein [Merismopedia sp. SIO2A8]